MKNLIVLPIVLLAMGLLLNNCASLTGFQDGRTVGKGNGEIIASLNFSQSPNFQDIEDENDLSIPRIFFPSAEIGYRYGVGEKIDVGFRLNTNLNVALGMKAQLVGDRQSPAALALGFEGGTFSLIGGLWNASVPVYFSLHPSENFTWYLTPRFTYQFSTLGSFNSGFTYLGGNTGFMFGRRAKFGLDVGLYRVGADGSSIGTFQVGLGGRIPIGNN